jgi:glycosyltransferase involved in cell wall biosynthesis
MKILMVNTSEHTGGAAIAADRLMVALQSEYLEVNLLVRDKQTDRANVLTVGHANRNKPRFVWERLVIYCQNGFSRKSLFDVSIANTGNDITKHPAFAEADIIHLHWINQGMLSLHDLNKIKESGKPVVWTLHDMWPMTGICHHAGTCNRYATQCGQCPFLHSGNEADLSNRVFRKKLRIYKNWPLEVVTVSTWLAGKVKESALLRNHSVHVIPNTLDLTVFTPVNATIARKELGLPTEKKILVFGAAKIDHSLKGFPLLRQALKTLGEKMDLRNVHLVLFGSIKSGMDYLQDLPVSYTFLGSVDDKTLSLIYSAANALVAPSLYETFGQTLIEAQASGCVPVCFNNSGQTDIIEHLKTGYLADYLSVPDLAEGIYWALNEVDRQHFSQIAREYVSTKYSGEKVAASYQELYHSILEKAR